MNLCREIQNDTIKKLVMIGISRKGENSFKTKIDPSYLKRIDYLGKDNKKIYVEVTI